MWFWIDTEITGVAILKKSKNRIHIRLHYVIYFADFIVAGLRSDTFQ